VGHHRLTALCLASLLSLAVLTGCGDPDLHGAVGTVTSEAWEGSHGTVISIFGDTGCDRRRSIEASLKYRGLPTALRVTTADSGVWILPGVDPAPPPVSLGATPTGFDSQGWKLWRVDNPRSPLGYDYLLQTFNGTDAVFYGPPCQTTDRSKDGSQ
jgi:hypothetical protein